MPLDRVTLKAQRLYDGAIAVAGRSATLLFSRIWAGVGWPESEQGALCVLGESFEGVYHGLAESRGSLFELGSAAETARRELLVECFWVDASDDVSVTYFRRLDFSGRKAPAKPRLGGGRSPLHVRAPGYADAEDRPAIVSVRDAYREHFRAALETLAGVAAAGRLVIPQDLCPSAAFALKRDLAYLLQSPVIKALVWVLTAMESTRDQAPRDAGPDDGWYRNFRRT
ncbi:MAG: hypothetical protein ACP5M0_15750 [Desulfomonilaceae bacterium]